MASYTVNEVMDLVTGDDFDSEGESDIEDPSFPLSRASSNEIDSHMISKVLLHRKSVYACYYYNNFKTVV